MVGVVGRQRERPHALDAGQVDGRLLLDADAVADYTQGAHLEGTWLKVIEVGKWRKLSSRFL